MMAVMLIATTDTSDDDYDDGSEDDCNRNCCRCHRLVYAGASLRQVLVFTYFLNVCCDLSSCPISSLSDLMSIWAIKLLTPLGLMTPIALCIHSSCPASIG